MDQVVGRRPLRMVASLSGVSVVLAAVASTLNWDYVLQLDFLALLPYKVAILRGLWLTIVATSVSVAIGLVAGTMLAILAEMPSRIVRAGVRIWLELWRDLPLVVVLFWVHFSLPLLTGMSSSAMVSGVIAISVQASAYLADVVGAGIQAVSRGQWEAADSLGLPRRVCWWKIIIPQSFVMMLPSLTNVMLGFLKASAILALLPAGELMSVGADVASRSFRPIETFIVIGLVYLVLGWAASFGSSRLEHRLSWARG